MTHKGGVGGKTDRLFRLSTYGFPIPLNTFRSSKSNNKRDISPKLKIVYFMTPVLPIRGRRGTKLDRLFRLSTYGFPISLNTFRSYKSNNKGDISPKVKIGYYDPSLYHKGGRGAKMTGYLDSPHMVSQYLSIHSEALKENKGDISQQN